MCWHGDGKGFACSYSDGSIVHWNRKSDTKPEKIAFPHGKLLTLIILLRLSYVWGEKQPCLCMLSSFSWDSTHKLTMQLETVGLLSHIRVRQLSLNR